MKLIVEFEANKKHAGQKIEKALKEEYPTIPMSIVFKLLRKAQIKVNQNIAQRGQVLGFGDKIIFEIEEKFLKRPKIEIPKVYEDDNILVVDKPYGVPSHPDSNKEYSVVDWIKEHYKSKEFVPTLCHRLDRNTSGLLVIAKNRQVLNEMLKYISRRAIKKKYLCITKKNNVKRNDVLIHYLKKDERKSKVFISDIPMEGFAESITKYKIVKEVKNLFLLDVELETGRTHQIRSQLSYVGIPILGDNKYGDWELNKFYEVDVQCLCAYYLRFDIGKKGILHYLDGKKIIKEMVKFPISIEGLNEINIYKERGIEI